MKNNKLILAYYEKDNLDSKENLLNVIGSIYLDLEFNKKEKISEFGMLAVSVNHLK